MKILTFDIEEWFHLLDHEATKTESQWSGFETRIRRNVDRILSMLDDHGQMATFFCLGWVARSYPDVIRKIAEAGHEIASHSDRHQLAYEQSPAEFAADLSNSLAALSDVIGRGIDTYRIPGFSLTSENQHWVFEKLIDAGIRVDCSVFPAARGHGGLPEFSEEAPTRILSGGGVLKEFPVNTARLFGRRVVFSGGGYFRLFPYWIIRRLMRSDRYVMTYFHPRDFDPGQPVIPGLSNVRRFKSYYGLAKCEEKLRMLLRDFQFLTVSEATQRVDWEATSTVSV